jgi:glycosyltransferase involved in cell wall biosynthesis
LLRLAFLDDYPRPYLGHHPDYLHGLAEASLRLPGVDRPTLLYCPDSFVSDRTLAPGLVHRPLVRATDDSMDGQRAALGRACREAANLGATVLVDLFFDETHDLFPVDRRGLRIVHVLHRPVEFADTLAAPEDDGRDGAIKAYLDRAAPDDLFVVHTAAALAAAVRWIPAERLLRLTWPSASAAEIAERFASATVPTGERHVLLIGNAKDTKGVRELHAALAGDGPLLRIVGQQSPGVEAALREAYPRTRVGWETGWIDSNRLGEAIRAASVVVFPYHEKFGRHGGASGALAHASSFGKPLVVSTVLADQVPAPDAVLFVEPGDVSGLRQAIDEAMRSSEEFHALARKSLATTQDRHSYDRHLFHMLRFSS